MAATRYACFLLAFSLCLCACERNEGLFKSLPSSHTNINFENRLEKKDAFGILYFLYYYNGGGVAVGDINNDGLPDIYFTANSAGNNKLYLNKGNLEFEDVTESAGVKGNASWCSGVTMADINGDGFLDIYVSAVSGAHGLHGRNELYINNGNGTFTESAEQYGLHFSGFSSQAAFFDYDRDGDLDCYILNQSHRPNDNIVDTSNRRKFDPRTGDRLYRNDISTTGKFTDVSAEAGIYQSSLGYGLGLAIADINNDGWDDIYVGNDFHENDYYYVNNGDGTFTESGEKHFRHYSRFSMGNDVADFNNDGHLDVITVDMLPPDEKVLKTYGSEENADIYNFKIARNGFQYQYSKNCLQRNNGNGTSFSETALISGVSATDWSWAPLFADFDNDGNKDLFVSSGIVKRPVDLDYVRFVSNLYMQKNVDGTDKYDDMALEKMPDGSSYPFFFKGDGKLSFNNVSKEWGTAGMKGYYNGAAYADLDNDGDLDMIINCIDAPAVILENRSSQTNAVSISFRGDSMNRHGIGAKAYLFTGGKMQFQQLMLTRGFQSSCDTRLHFGTGLSNQVDSLIVVWPDQSYEVIRSLPANTPVVADKKNAGGEFNYAAIYHEAETILQPLQEELSQWQHRENDFFDYNVQYLIPHAQSTRGPKVAVGDVNGDGLDDLYVCGAMGQPGAILIQQPSGRFSMPDTLAFAADAGAEDVDAEFFDANGDGYLDLYVVSGGNELTGQSPMLPDRLYFNDGKGNFSKSTASLPAIYSNKSCVTIADIDRDGDLDIFIGTLADARAYGMPQSSNLLVNDGKGNFSLHPDNNRFAKLGMVTDAAFADLDGNGYPDLVVCGEWMPLTLFTNKNGKFEKSQLPGSSGWWQSIYLSDVNGDGNIDFLAGNWGFNTKFWSGKNGPLKMYVSDFDRNGQIDQLVSYTIDGEEFPFLAKDEVERALPLLKKHYLYYADYAGVPMKDVFYGWVDTIKPIIAERLGSVVAYGDGKGAFRIEELPADLQLAPIFSFLPIHNTRQYLAGGNFYDVIPYEGRYDAQPLAVFQSIPRDSIVYKHQPQLLQLEGQVRDLKAIRTAGSQMRYVAAYNNGRLQFFSQQ